MRASIPARIRPADSRLVTGRALFRPDAEPLRERDRAGGHHAGHHRRVADPDRDAHEHAGLAAPGDVDAADDGAPGDDEEHRRHEHGAQAVERPHRAPARAEREEAPDAVPAPSARRRRALSARPESLRAAGSSCMMGGPATAGEGPAMSVDPTVFTE